MTLHMEYTLIRAHKRSLSLQVSPTGEIIARAPRFMPKFLIDRFVAAKSDWIAKRQRELTLPKKVQKAYFTIDRLKAFITKKVKEYSDILNLCPKGIRFTQVTTYWGTCNPADILSFNLSLRFTRADVVTYVVVHELAHLKYKGHGKRFWDFVTKNYPYTTEAKKILRKFPRSV